jgi:hypothetical protein
MSPKAARHRGGKGNPALPGLAGRPGPSLPQAASGEATQPRATLAEDLGVRVSTIQGHYSCLNVIFIITSLRIAERWPQIAASEQEARSGRPSLAVLANPRHRR